MKVDLFTKKKKKKVYWIELIAEAITVVFNISSWSFPMCWKGIIVDISHCHCVTSKGYAISIVEKKACFSLKFLYLFLAAA